MGQRQNKSEIEYGNDCGTAFPPGKTPKYCYARFAEIVTCPLAPAIAPNGQVFKLTQTPSYVCVWHYSTIDWIVELFYTQFPLSSKLLLWHKATFRDYFSKIEPWIITEGHVFLNANPHCVGVYQGHSGQGILTWELESMKVRGLMNIETSDDTFMEMVPISDGSRVYKYCRLRDATNVKILYDP